jgi:hypothetical protein
MTLRDTETLGQDGDTLAKRYQHNGPTGTDNRLAEVELMWECEFKRDLLSEHPELRNHPLVRHAPIKTRNALYGVRNKAMSLYKMIEKARDHRVL